MKFNDKEMALWASSFVPDKEGMLEKKGAARGQGYKQRWFRLKGNLLFYFRVDECGGWESTGEPMGMILLERCHVEQFQHESRPYSFMLTFENDDSRSYFLSAFSQFDLEGWIAAIRMASYEGLRTTLYQLQKKLMSLTGEDPLKDKGMGVSHLNESSPRPKIRFHQTVRRAAYFRSSNKQRAMRIRSLATSPDLTGPQYELSLSCSRLPVGKDGRPPTTLVRLRCYSQPGDTDALSTLSHTEVVESSCSPSYSLLVLLEIGLLCPPSGFLQFEVFTVDEPRADDLESSTCKLSDDSVVLKTNTGTCKLQRGSSKDPQETEVYRVGKQIGRAECLVSMVTGNTDGRELKLTLNKRTHEKDLVCGFLHIVPLKLEDSVSPMPSPKIPRRNAMSPLERCSPIGILPNIMLHSVRCHFSFPGSKGSKMKVFEEMAESIFNVQVPIELLKCYIKEDTNHLEELYTVGALEEVHSKALQEYEVMLFESIGFYTHQLKELESVADTCGFKPSSIKKDDSLQFVPCNLHIQRMRVQSQGKGEKAYSVVTFGCPADHVVGFKNGGLRRLLSECRSSPNFISRWSEGKSSAVKHSIVRLMDIRESISFYKNALYSACANTSPQDMNEAIIAISKQVQQLLWQMQSGVVSEAIETLIMARPGAMGGGGNGEGGGGGGSGEGTLQRPVSPQAKRMSMKRRSLMPGGGSGGGRCTCGKCLKCVPSPSDWVWNGKRLVQVSTREWKLADSCDSVQQNLVTLVESVEAATTKVVDQQHEAVASEVGYAITTYKPTYVWSAELIPLFMKLNQTLDGLFRVAMSSLSFTIVQLDSYVEGLKVLKSRRDVVFSQALTALVTSFYLTLSHYYTDATFFQQIREIGFLAQFESLLSSLGDESLLSSLGDENGMLEDMCVAVAELGGVSFQLGELRNEGSDDIPFDFHIIGTRDCLTVRLLFARRFLAALPNEQLREGKSVAVVPVLFTQGVNEKQTLANIKQQIQLQEDINLQGLDKLSTYVASFDKLMSNTDSSQAQLEAVRVKDLLELLKRSYSTHKSKNVDFLLTVEQLCQRLRGGRLTSCKSGKDRTGMSVTLEECALLRTVHHLPNDAFMRTLSTLRSHGTRLENCAKNTGHKCYHFNQLQLMLLPKLLTPPPYTCRDPE